MAAEGPRPQWTRSNRCDSDSCVEVAPVAGQVLMRDSTAPDGEHLTFSAAAWQQFLHGVRAGEFDAQHD